VQCGHIEDVVVDKEVRGKHLGKRYDNLHTLKNRYVLERKIRISCPIEVSSAKALSNLMIERTEWAYSKGDFESRVFRKVPLL
jgi:hypothetical protein